MTGRCAAERLINTLDRITRIDFNHIPNEVDGSKWYFRNNPSLLTMEEQLKRKSLLEKNADGAWRFTPETVNTIGNLYASVSHLSVVEGVIEYELETKLKSHLPAWTSEELLMFTKGQWLGFLFYFLCGNSCFKSLVRYLTTLYIRAIVKESLNFKDKDHYKATLPFGQVLN